MMKISVLTVYFNAATTIRQTLDSFCSQSYVDREMIVIDGASKDGTADIALSYTLFAKPIRKVGQFIAPYRRAWHV